jgi:hypothetical protein
MFLDEAYTYNFLVSIQKSEIENFKNQAKVLEGCFLNMRKR